jgi:hypothetical protein
MAKKIFGLTFPLSFSQGTKEMRTSVSSTILSLAVVAAWMGWTATSIQAETPEPCQAACNTDCSAACETSCEDFGQRGGLLSFLDRCGDCNRCGPQWSFNAEAVALQRSTTRHQQLFKGANDPNLINSQTMDFPLAYGAQIGAIRHGVCGWDVELAYMQVDGFEATRTDPGFVSMVTDGTGGNYIVTDASARYNSALYSGELNLRKQWRDGITLLSGFRMLELDENLNTAGTAVVGSELVTLDVNAYNHLYGFQVGADVEVYNYGGPLQINTICKAGVYQNYASQNIRRIDTGVSDEMLGATRERTAFMGEVGVVATYSITKRLAFRATVQAVWLEGIALAPEQIGESNFRTSEAYVDAAGGVFYYGGGLGLEYRF